MSNEIAQKLDEARALVEKGWTRGVYHRQREHPWQFWVPRDSYCLQGALSAVGADRYWHLFRQLQPSITTMVGFNDAQKSKEPVVALLRKAAELARAEAA